MGEYLTATNLILGALAYLGLCGLAGLYVSVQLGRPSGEGFALGALFGPVGLVVAACLPPRAVPPGPVPMGEAEDDVVRDHLARMTERLGPGLRPPPRPTPPPVPSARPRRLLGEAGES